MPHRHSEEDDEATPQEELSPFQLIERAVDLALQAHGVWNLEVSETVKEIVQVAENLAKSESDVKLGLFDLRKLGAADRESVIRAIAIYMGVATELFGMTRAQMAKKLAKYLNEFGDA